MMITLRTTITYRGDATAKRRDLAAAVREGFHDVGAHWVSKYLPLHFSPVALRRYPGVYTPRTAAYDRRKRATTGRADPMVLTGAMRRQVLSLAVVRPTPRRLRVTMSGVRALNLSGKANYPNFRAELTALNAQESQTLAGRLDARVTRRLEMNRETRTETVR